MEYSELVYLSNNMSEMEYIKIIENFKYSDRLSYVYMYVDPEFFGKYDCGNFSTLYKPLYVGKGTGKRMFDHLHNYVQSKEKDEFHYRLSELSEKWDMKKYCFKITDDIPEKDAFIFEYLLTKKLGIKNSGGILLNQCFGGLGGISRKMPEDEKKRRTETHPHKGKTYEEIYGAERAKILKKQKSESLKGHPSYQNKNRFRGLISHSKSKNIYRWAINMESGELEWIQRIEFESKKYTTHKGILYKVKYPNGSLRIYRDSADLVKDLKISHTLLESCIKDKLPYHRKRGTTKYHEELTGVTFSKFNYQDYPYESFKKFLV